MDWQVQIEHKAQKAVKKISDPYKTNIIEALDNLVHDPQPHNSKKLKGISNFWCIRIETYRMVYKIFDNKLIILVAPIGHRSDIYKGL